MVLPAKFVAAFDASGDLDQPLIVVAGFISSQADWQSFHTQWTERLVQDGLEYFHMVDFAASRKGFKIGWKENEPRRERLYGDLMGIIQSHVYRQFGCSIEIENFSKLSPEKKKAYALNAYSLACRTCAADVRQWQKQEHFEPPTAYAFEAGDIGPGLVSKRFLEDGFPEPTFLPKTYTPLQAADILAYELHKPHRDLLAGKPRINKFRWGFEQLCQIPGNPGYYSSKDFEELDRKLESLSYTTTA